MRRPRAAAAAVQAPLMGARSASNTTTCTTLPAARRAFLVLRRAAQHRGVERALVDALQGHLRSGGRVFASIRQIELTHLILRNAALLANLLHEVAQAFLPGPHLTAERHVVELDDDVAARFERRRGGLSTRRRRRGRRRRGVIGPRAGAGGVVGVAERAGRGRSPRSPRASFFAVGSALLGPSLLLPPRVVVVVVVVVVVSSSRAIGRIRIRSSCRSSFREKNTIVR